MIVFVGDGSYLMMNSDLYSSVLSGHKLIVMVCDNGGFAVINRLQVNQGGESFNNLIADCRHRATWSRSTSPRTPRRWAARPRPSTSIAELEPRSGGARAADRTYVIALRTARLRLDRGWELLGGRRSRGLGAPGGRRCPGSRRPGQARTTTALMLDENE